MVYCTALVIIPAMSGLAVWCVYLADMDLRDHELRYEYDCSVIKITRTDTTSFLTIRRASGVNLIGVKHRPIYPC